MGNANNKALFLDRDGVINHEVEYVHKIEDFKFIDGVFDTCRNFQLAGYKIIVVTNQAGIAYGYYSEEDFHILNDWMIQQFKDNGVELTEVYYCPHHHVEKAQPPYKQNCSCRKPQPGMLLDAIAKYQLDPSQSVMVGDKGIDMQAAINAGVHHKVLALSGHSLSQSDLSLADEVIDSIKDLSLNN